MNVPSKTIVEKCKAEGITSVKNHMSTLSAGLHATICEWFSETRSDTAVETAERVDLDKVRIKRRGKRAPAKKEAGAAAPAVAEKDTAEEAAARAPAVATEVMEPPEAETDDRTAGRADREYPTDRQSSADASIMSNEQIPMTNVFPNAILPIAHCS